MNTNTNPGDKPMTIASTIAAKLIAALNWLADRDAAHRAARKLSRMPADRLSDIGLTRDQADALDFAPASRPARISRSSVTARA